jgi:putative adhesin
MSAFWNAWRKEVIRGAFLFSAILAIGLSVYYMIGQAKTRVHEMMPEALRELRGSFDVDLHSGPRKTAESWMYHAKLAPKQWLWIHNTNGSVTVEPSKGDSVEVMATKTYLRSEPSRVREIAVPYEGGVAICAVWGPGDATCSPDEDFKLGSARHNDVAVDFTVRLPAKVRLGATTVNGSVHVNGVSGPVVARTVSGDVDVVTAAGPVRARTVNGGVHARMTAFGDTGEVQIITVNGSVTLELPSQLDADVDATTVNGSIDSAYPLGSTGNFVGRKLHGTIGKGGRELHVTTVNGSIMLKKATPTATRVTTAGTATTTSYAR